MCLNDNEGFITSRWGRYYSINSLANDVQGSVPAIKAILGLDLAAGDEQSALCRRVL